MRTLCILFALFCAAWSIKLLTHQLARASSLGEQEEMVTKEIRRMRKVREALPATGEVGYTSDLLAGVPVTVNESLRDLYLTQHALLPLRVSAMSASLVVGNFRHPGSADRLIAQGGLVLLRDFGEGVCLLQRRP